MNTRSVLPVVCALALVLGGCTPGVHVPTALPNRRVTLTIDVPFNGTVVPLGNHVPLEVQADAQGATVDGVVFLVNGSQAAVAGGTGGVFDGDWLPGAAGEYYVQARATLSDGSAAVSEPSRICVVPFASSSLFPDYTRGYLGPCPLPSQIRIQTTSGVILVSAVVAPTHVQFVLAPGCTAVAPTVTFIAQVDDPRDLVALVSARIPAGGGFLIDARRILNWTTTRGEGIKEYRATFPLYIGAAGSTAIDTVSSMHWLVDAWGGDGSLLGSTNGDLVYVVHQCRNQFLVLGPSVTPEVLEIFPSETPKPPLAPPTFNFSKNAFCRKGPDTSFPDVTAIVAGDTVDILNVSEDGFWYYIFWKQFNAKCWVAAGTGVANGDLTGLKVLVGPDLPQPGAPPAGKKPTPAPAPCNPLIKVCP